MKRIAFIILGGLSLLLSGCKQEVLEPEQQVSGSFALDEGDGLTTQYLEFDKGYLTVVQLDRPRPLAENKIWNLSTSQSKTEIIYTISEGNLYTKSGPNGPISQKDGTLTIGSTKYSRLDGFEKGPYSRIVVEKEVTFPYTEQDISIPFTIERPIPAGEVKVAPVNCPWITGLKIQDGKITGHQSGTSTDRSGTIKLSYTEADDVTITVRQAPSTFIRPASESLTLEYPASTQTLGYTIENPVATSTLTASSTASWITNIQISGTQISFSVSENNSGAARSATLTLRYAGAPDVTVPVTQKWSASSFTLTPTSKTVDYTGGTFNFSYAVNNPREGITVTATSQANWITDVKQTGTTVSYKVAENNSGSQRTGKIKLTYGNYATAEFTVTQSWSASGLTLTPASQSVNYVGGSFNFSYSVNNPRDGVTVTATSQANWITDVKQTGTTVSYKVAENNSGTSRTGKIKLTYGSYATIEFSVMQSWSASSLTLTPASQSVNYVGGSFNFSYSVNNPREGITVTATSQANWITDVRQTGTTVSYKVAENNSTASRTGKIKLIYGSYATAEFSITQSGKPVQSITLNKTALPLHPGNVETLVATVDPSDAVLSWASSNSAVATVSTAGKVTAVGNGSAVITASATDGSGKKATCTVTVTTLVTDVSLNKSTLVLNEGASETLTVTISPSTASNKSVTWSSNNTSAATVDQNGKVTAVSKGTATITATANDGSGKKATCAVTVKRLVSSISLNKTSITIYTGEAETLTATVLPDTADDRSITWSSSSTSIATVSSSGVVTAKAVGTATITATANDGSGKKATCSVTVKQYVTGITLDKTSLVLNEGGSETLTATVAPSTASDKSVTWSSTNTSLATVDQNGKVTAVSKGTATITATANDGSGVFVSCSVVVRGPCPAGAVDLGLSVYWAPCNLGTSGFVSSPEVYGEYYAWGETVTKSNYSWSTYKFGTSSSGPFSKYNTQSSYGPVDNKTVLDPEDDVAHVKLGGQWRMPTDEEWTELRERCTWICTYHGARVTGPNGNSIFLPLAESSIPGEYLPGYYWSSSLNTDDPNRAWYVIITILDVWRSSSSRYDGFPVRPVSE